MRGAIWRTVLAGLLCTMAVAPPVLCGQAPAWRLTAAASHAWFGSAAEDTVSGDFRARPSTTVGWSLAADHTVGRLRVGIGLGYTASDVEGDGDLLSLIYRDAHMRAVEIAALLTLPLVRIGSAGAEALLVAGPALTIWDITGEQNQTVFGGTASLQLAAPITSGWRLLAFAGGTYSASPLADVPLSADFEPTALWSGRAGLGIQYGL